MTPQEFRQKWINALRSGTYKQGKKHLHNKINNKFCCLGVACDLYSKEYPGQITLSMPLSDNVIYYDNESTLLPNKVANALELNSRTGNFTTTGFELNSLWQLNDASDKSFEQIADFIESNPQGLFKNA